MNRFSGPCHRGALPLLRQPMNPLTGTISARSIKLPVNLKLSVIFPMRINSLCELLKYSAVGYWAGISELPIHSSLDS